MSIWDWLATPGGVELEHALIVLLLAIATALAEYSRRRIGQVKQRTDAALADVTEQVRQATAAVKANAEAHGGTLPDEPKQ